MRKTRKGEHVVFLHRGSEQFGRIDPVITPERSGHVVVSQGRIAFEIPAERIIKRLGKHLPDEKEPL